MPCSTAASSPSATRWRRSRRSSRPTADAKHAAGVNTGTSALHLALLAAGIGPGDEVITVAHTFMATVSAIRYAGAKPVFVDIDPTDATPWIPAAIEAAITPHTKAIIPVHLYGQCADMDPILEIAKQHNLLVIEDACQAHGAEYKGRRAGSIGDMAAFSFYPGKNLGACGEGGAVVTSDPELHQEGPHAPRLGARRSYHHVLEGYNYRMDNIQGAFLRVKLRTSPPGPRPAAPPRRSTASSSPARRSASRPRRVCQARLSHLRHPHEAAAGVAGCAAGTGHPDRHPLPDTGSPAAGIRGSGATGQAISRIRSVQPTKYCRCRCSLRLPRVSVKK